MRTKILNRRDLQEGWQGIMYIRQAIGYRVKDLTRMSVSLFTLSDILTLYVENFSQQRHDPEKQFQSVAFGMVGYLSFPGRLSLLTSLPYSLNTFILKVPYGL
jgi:hypothetical protein